MECSGPSKNCTGNFDEMDQEFEGGHHTKCPDSFDAVCAKDILPYEIRKYCASTPKKQFSEFKLLEGDAMKTQHGICDEMMVDGNTVIACTCS